MIIKVDAKQLEWRTYLELSRDAVGIREVFAKLDVHADNQRIFNLPTRLVAKTFLFRWIYRGSAYAYSTDHNFAGTSTSVDFWNSVINAANSKYHILYEYQNKILYEAKHGKIITIPSEREWLFKPKQDKRGQWYYKDSDITNYINQGFAADIVIIIRRIIRRKLTKLKEYHKGLILPINTVHDDIELDVDNDPTLLYNVCLLLEDSFTEIHDEFFKLFKYQLLLPFEGEVSFGKNLQELIEFKRDKGEEQFYAT